jgi:hypothetical protein
MLSFELCGSRPKSQHATKKRMLVVVGRAKNGLKMSVNRALSPQANYWSNVNNERFHEPH